MIFTLVTAVQEKLNEIIDQIKSRREEEKERKQKEAEEAEKVCFNNNYLFFIYSPLSLLTTLIHDMKFRRQWEDHFKGMVHPNKWSINA